MWSGILFLRIYLTYIVFILNIYVYIIPNINHVYFSIPKSKQLL